ncbi:hypothetical protein MMC25_006167 [Agyrium rufum]|nr:hypothetical protein [Agyrium rufum]
MPPNPSPTDSPNDSPEPRNYLEELFQLNSTVPDYAATLTNLAIPDSQSMHGDDHIQTATIAATTAAAVAAAAAQNASRTSPSPQQQHHHHHHHHHDHATSNGTDYFDTLRWRRPPYVSSTEYRQAHEQRDMQRRAMRRALLESRMQDEGNAGAGSGHGVDNGGGGGEIGGEGGAGESMARPFAIPAHRHGLSSARSRLSYHNWAPGSAETDNEPSQSWVRPPSPPSWAETIREYRRLPRTNERETDPSLFAEEVPPLRRRSSREAGLPGGRSHFVGDESGSDLLGGETSLRTTALLQSVRRSSQLSARSRDRLENNTAEHARRHSSGGPRGNTSNTPNSTSNSSNNFAEELMMNDSHTLERFRQEGRSAPRYLQNLYRQYRANQENQKPAAQPEHTSKWLEETIKYLERARSCSNYAERVSSAALGGFLQGEWFADDHSDFILDTKTISPPAPTSWLKPGSTFSGSQHASQTMPTMALASTPPFPSSRTLPPGTESRFRSHSSRSSPYNFNNNNINSQATSGSRGNLPQFAHQTLEGEEMQNTWPVKVTIHSVSYETMTLTGTMEAFNVPKNREIASSYSRSQAMRTVIATSNNGNGNSTDARSNSSSSSSTPTPSTQETMPPYLHPSPSTNAINNDNDNDIDNNVPKPPDSSTPTNTRSLSTSTPSRKDPSTSITTFLTGEIIDFNLFTLQTSTYPSTPSNDSTYWRKLGPFKSLSEKDIVAGLVSAKWMDEHVSKKWILMRWKEQCFVTPSDAQLGLTISGFYYVCLRREDGWLEGLYYDPLSSPYQHLELRAEGRGGGPSYSFR